MEPVAGGSAPRALLRVGGSSVLSQQVRLMLTQDCQRIVCLSSAGLTPDLIAVQHTVEKAGATFHVIAGPRALAGLVTAADEVFALEDGLIAPSGELTALLQQGQAVLVQPIELGLELGFERIDLNTASAGAMRIPGHLVERLAELPADCNAVSALQRIALQSGVPQREIPAVSQKGLIWALVRHDGDALALEPLWIRLRTSQNRPLGPSRWLALGAVRRFGAALLHAGSGAKAIGAAAIALALLGLGAGWFGWVAPALLACALGWILHHGAVLLARIEAEQASRLASASHVEHAFGWAFDGVLVALLGWADGATTHELALDQYFPGLMLIALLRIVPRAIPDNWAAWLEDRALVALLLVVAIMLGLGELAVELAVLLLAGTAITLVQTRTKLTPP